MKIFVLKINWGGIKPHTDVYLFKTLEKAEGWKEGFYEACEEHPFDVDFEITIEEKLLWN